MVEKARLLLVEDTLSLATLYQEYLDKGPYQVTHATGVDDALAQVERALPDAALLDLRLPDGSGMSLLRVLRRRAPDMPVIVMTAHGSVSVAVEAMRSGAADFLTKPFAAERLITTLDHALERARLKRELRELSAARPREAFCGFIGGAPAMQAIYRILENAAASRATVFLKGESGTGKELAAAAVHRLSPRREGPFVAINCAAIPRDLIESEIFGHIRGAFTGAVADRAGAAQLADGGTLFLDEICDMDAALQAKLLRFVQLGAFQPVGSTRTLHTDVRFICATNRDPMQEVREGRFREDLYYRLHVVPVTMPPLRARGEDVMTIAAHFLARFTQEEEKHFTCFAPDAEALLRAHPWPGNVRELENAVRTAVVLHDGDAVTAAMLPTTLHPSPKPAQAVQPSIDPVLRIRPLAVLEREAVEHAVQSCQGNIARAAAHLGISPSTLYRKRAAWAGIGDAAS